VNDRRSEVIALIMAAGRGERAGLNGPKQYHPLCGKPVLAHTVDALAMTGLIDRMAVVIHADDQAACAQAIAGRVLAPAIIGGATRQQSVMNGLCALDAAEDSIVLIHDAARPFVPRAVIERLIGALDEADGAIPTLPVFDSLTENGRTVDRERLRRVQTPQAFRLGAILRAHHLAAGGATDDGSVARAAGLNVVEVEGDEALRKLTTLADVKWADRHLGSQMISRTGMGFDVHRFGDGDHLWLGGVKISHDRGLIGHSDADVALHALTDALLGAIGDGDIGTHFPPTDPQWRGASSDRFVEHACKLVKARGGVIDHVDVTLICEEPKIGPHRDAIRARLAALLQLGASRISVKATTTERLGFTGRREGVAAQAVATLRLPENM